MKRKEFLILLGFNHAASACNPRLILNRCVPTPHHDDGLSYHYSDDGKNMAAFNHGVPIHYYKLGTPWYNDTAKTIPWPDNVKQYLRS